MAVFKSSARYEPLVKSLLARQETWCWVFCFLRNQDTEVNLITGLSVGAIELKMAN